MRDIQRQKVYDWEDSQSWMIKDSYLSQKQCQDVIKRLNKIFKRRVRLRFRNGHGKCYAFNQNEIMIRNEWGRSYSVLLHEYAHCITNDLHGARFVAEYCLLLHHLHPEQPSIKDLVKSLNDANVEFADFERTISKKRLSKRHKPFEDVSLVIIPEPKRYIKRRMSAKKRVQKLLDEWVNPDDIYSNFYDVAYYEHVRLYYVNINGIEHGIEFTSWKEVEDCLLEAIEQKLHLHKDYIEEEYA